MDEVNLIQTYLAPLAGPEGLALKDDAALLSPEAGTDLVLTKDTLVEGVHFPSGQFGADVAERLMRVNLSDLAAKGANPKGYLLSLALSNDVDLQTIAAFTAALQNLQRAYDYSLFGGDTVSIDGPIVVSATFIGEVPSGKMVRRNGARVGHDVWMSGSIGDGYLGLKTVMKDTSLSATQEMQSFWQEAYWRPQPRMILRQLLRAYASAATDISDGLIADLDHICLSSHVGMTVIADDVPLSNPTTHWLGGKIDSEESLVSLLTAGDDYEIAFTASDEYRDNIETLGRELGVNLSRIGLCVPGNNTELKAASGRIIPIASSGYVHFQEKTR